MTAHVAATPAAHGARPRPLVVTDLDGTLLTSKKTVSPASTHVINDYVRAGGLFTIATARAAFGCVERLSGLRLELPGIVMNGAALYDFTEGRYEHVFPIPDERVAEVATIVDHAGAGAFVYAVTDGRMRMGHARVSDLSNGQYNSEAARRAHPPFAVLGATSWTRLGRVIFISVVGTDEQMASVARLTSSVPGVLGIPYRNVYTDRECFEITSADAGKENAIRVLREGLPDTELVVFGDNHNDLGMMRMADVSYAPANAVAAARAAAHHVVAGNDEDGVARQIALLDRPR